jgi:hypothetical protein
MKKRILSKNYPNSVLFVLISSLDFRALTQDVNFINFYDKVSKQERNGRLYKINSKGTKEINNLISFFTGSRPEINGVKGNLITNENQLNYYDSIFKRFKKSHIQSSIIGKYFFINIIIINFINFFVNLMWSN